MREDDLRAVLHIERRSFSIPWSESTFRGLLRRQSASLLVAELEGRLVAYAALWFAADDAELGDLAVLPEVRGRGIGRWLLARAMEDAAARGARQLYLEVRESNHPARRMYERAGFSTAGIRPSYYSEPREDAILMTRALAPEDAR